MHDEVGIPTLAGQDAEARSRLALLSISQVERKMRISVGELIVMTLSLTGDLVLLPLDGFHGVPEEQAGCGPAVLANIGTSGGNAAVFCWIAVKIKSVDVYCR